MTRQKEYKYPVVKDIVGKILLCQAEDLFNISIKSLSEEFNIPPKRLSKIFEEDTDQSFKQFVRNHKMNQSLTLLLQNSNLKVEDIAKMIGYNPVYFVNIFREYFGKSPLEFRKNGIF